MDFEKFVTSPLDQTLRDLFAVAKEMQAGSITMEVKEDGNPVGAVIVICEDAAEYLAAIKATKARLQAMDEEATLAKVKEQKSE